MAHTQARGEAALAYSSRAGFERLAESYTETVGHLEIYTVCLQIWMVFSHCFYQISVVFKNFRYLTLNQHVPGARNSINSAGRFCVPAPGFEVSPADEDALEVCKEYCWQAQALAFADGSAYCTGAAADKLGHSMAFQLRMSSNAGVRFGPGSTYLETRGNAVAFSSSYADHPVFAACGFDVLLRQPCEFE